jgi:hypothetical protein
MCKSDIKIQAFGMKSRPDMLIFQGESVGGEKMGPRNARNIGISKKEHVFKIWGRSWVDLESYGIILEVRRCVF